MATTETDWQERAEDAAKRAAENGSALVQAKHIIEAHETTIKALREQNANQERYLQNARAAMTEKEKQVSLLRELIIDIASSR